MASADDGGVQAGASVDRRPAPTVGKSGGSGLLAAFSSLRIRNYRYFWAGQIGSAMAMNADLVVRSWVAWDLTHSSVAVALVNLIRSLPTLVLGVFGGVIADRFDRKRTLIVVQLWSLAVYAGMAAVVLTGHLTIWHVYAYAGLAGLGFSVNRPVRTSFVPQLVGRAQLLNALSLNTTAVNVARLAIPAAIGWLIAYAGNVGLALAVIAGFWAVTVWATFRIEPDPNTAPKPLRGSMAGQMLEGIRYMFGDRTVFALIVLGLGPLAFGMAYTSMLPQFVTERLHGGPEGVGMIPSIAGIGGVAGGLLIASQGDMKHKGLVMVAAGAAYGGMLMFMYGASSLWMVFPLMIVVGASQTAFRASNNTAILQASPEALHGRIMSLTLLSNGLSSVAALAAGFVADHYGAAWGMFFIGAVCATVVLGIAALVPAVRRV